MAKILIDGKSYEVKEGNDLLATCLELGFNLPYFCWHPAMGSVGACRQCAVKQFKDEQDTHGKIVMACMTPAKEGTRISIDDPDAKAFRKSVVEWLMLNHPHDCPVCDEGGECHLQDMTVMAGHTYRRTRFKKRTFRNQDLGPFVNHEMNRCITCYRCVRFYRDYAGGRDFDAFAAHDHVYFGRHEDGVLENEFSGNLVEVCPTGVFTDKTLKKHYTRKWDLQTAPSVCAQCSLGCNTIPGERYGELRRVRNRYHAEINGYFLCDRGRYGYEFVNSEQRIRKAWARGSGSPENPVEQIATRFGDPTALSRMIGIGSPRATLESGFALKRLVGEKNFYSGSSARESRLVKLILRLMKNAFAHSPSLLEIEKSDAIFILGEDIANTAPRMALSVRQAVRNVPMKRVLEMKIPEWQDSSVREAIQQEKTPIFVAAIQATRMDDVAAQTCFASPDDLARLGFAVAHLIDPEAPAVSGLSGLVLETAREIAEALKSATSPTVISGTGSASEPMIQAAANIATALAKSGSKPQLSFVLPECNSLGAEILGGGSLEDSFEAAKQGQVDTAIVVENDLFRHARAHEVENFLKSLKQLIVIDSIASPMIPRASLILPAAATAESSGTYVNYEGRAQRFYRVFNPGGEIQESWRWIRTIMEATGSEEASNRWECLDDVLADLSRSDEMLHRVTQAAPPASYRRDGERVPRQSHRSSGRTAMHANVSVREPRPPEDLDSPLSFSMEGDERQPPSALIPRFWAPGWNSVQALNRFQSEIPGPLRGGSAGVRLIDSAKDSTRLDYFREIPEKFEAPPGKLLAVPIHHVFGSEETSALSPGIAERIPSPYIALSPSDAQRMGLNEGDRISISLFPNGERVSLRIEKSLASGTVGVPFGFRSMSQGTSQGMRTISASDFPAWCEVSKMEARGAA